MYRCAARWQAAILHHHLAFPHPSPLRLTPFISFTKRVSSISSPSQLHLHRPRCEGAAVMADMDFSPQGKPGMAKLFWGSCKREAYASLYHPFVISLAAGTLPQHTFRRFMAQDAYFLETFKHAYQVAMESTEDEDVKATIESLQRDVQDELSLHSSVMKSMGGDEATFEPNAATSAYCEFLQAAAAGSTQTLNLASAKIIAAMTPCMRLYAFIGQEIHKHIAQVPEHPYQQWIDTYSGPEFEAAASKVEQLLDKLTETVSKEEEKALLHGLYQRAMFLEVEFFTAQLLGPLHLPFVKYQASPETCLLLVSDFDSTCTISDSCPVLADLTVQLAGKIPGGRSASETSASLLRNKWDDLVMRYMDEYEELLNRTVSNKQGGGKVFTAEELGELLRQMSEFEQRANARVEEAAVLKGLSVPVIKEAGKGMPLREGCAELFKRLESCAETHILSVCWSKTFIEAVLAQGDVHVGDIKANELVFEGTTSTGRISFNVQSALDKERHFLELLKGRLGYSVYIGDSLTDLLCLLRADVGMVLGESSTLKQVYGEKIASLFRKAVALEQGSLPLSGYLFSVSSWYEVEAFLLGPARSPVL